MDKATEPVPAGTPLAELTGVRADGHRRARRQRPRGRGGHRGAHRVRPDRRRARARTSPRPSSRSGCAGSRCCWSTSPASLTASIFVINVLLHQPILDALLFSLAIAVGITPQLLPAVVSTSLAAGSRQLARRKVLVKRLVCIEDLGDVDVLFTDKTGTLTAGPHQLHARRAGRRRHGPTTAAAAGGCCAPRPPSTDGHAVGGNPLDPALWDSPAAAGAAGRAGRLRAGSACCPSTTNGAWSRSWSATATAAPTLVTKGAPETVLDRCVDVPAAARGRAGGRVRRRQPGRRRRHPARARRRPR